MDKDIKVLIVPDVHGRDFWRKPIYDNIDKDIIFLGDYLDPYPFEDISPQDAYNCFVEIVGIAKEHKNIKLLLGNHDCSYAISTNVCRCRHIWELHDEIVKVFNENYELFNIAQERIINKKRFLFSHAGLHKTWVRANKYIFKEGFKPTAKAFNELLHDPDKLKAFSNALSDMSWRRGGYDSYGSIVWADIREFINNKEIRNSKTIQIVGHTMLKEIGICVSKNMYCLDCKKVFYIDSKGVVRYYDTDEEIINPEVTN